MSAQEYHLSITQENLNLLSQLAEHTELSVQKLKSAIHKGALWHQKPGQKARRLRRIKTRLNPGDQLHLYYNEEILTSLCPQAQLLHDEEDYSVWYKPYGMLCQGSKWSDHCTINRFAELHLKPQRPAFVVHRLDRAASGLIVIAHSKSAARDLANQFEQRQTQKQYQIIVHGHCQTPPEGLHCDFPLDEKPAVSCFNAQSYNSLQNTTLVTVNIETGRKHQIRRHAAMLGFPIVGDRLHKQKDEQDLQLCAIKLAVSCPNTGQLKQYQLPNELKLCFVPLVD